MQPFKIGVKYYTNSYALDRMALLFDHLERPIITPNHTILANVNSRSRSICCRPSVCRLSVCNARALYTQSVGCTSVRRLKFSAIFLRHLVRWPSADIQEKFHGDRPRGTPPSGELNTRGVAILDLSKSTSRKRCKIGGKLVLIANRK